MKNAGAATSLLAQIEQRQAVVGVVGLGYVGLSLAMQFGKAGFHVVGFEVVHARVKYLNQGLSHIPDVSSNDLERLVRTGLFRATTDLDELCRVDTVSICVSTPLRKTKDPDISYIITASKRIAHTLRPGQLIILESTTYPGTTEELLLPMFQSRGFHVGRDYFLAFSPERIDPGNQRFGIRNTPKVIGGLPRIAHGMRNEFYFNSNPV